MSTYHGWRDEQGCLRVDVCEGGGGPADGLPHVEHHSPDGFECGYSGSGPADLALSICAHLYPGDDVQLPSGARVSTTAMRAYQQVKVALISTLPQDGEWTLHAEGVRAYVEQLAHAAQKGA